MHMNTLVPHQLLPLLPYARGARQLSDKLSRNATHYLLYTESNCEALTSTYINKLLVQIFISALDNIHEQTNLNMQQSTLVLIEEDAVDTY